MGSVRGWRERNSAMAQNRTSSTGHDKGEAGVAPEDRAAVASKLIDRFALWSGVAGLIPIPLVDLATVGGVQIQMVRRLSQVYDVPFTENRTKAVVASLMGSLIPATSGLGAASLLKGVPVLASGATYAIGQAFVQHFASGGTLLDFHAPDYREFIRSQRDMWVSRSKSGKTSESSATSS